MRFALLTAACLLLVGGCAWGAPESPPGPPDGDVSFGAINYVAARVVEINDAE